MEEMKVMYHKEIDGKGAWLRFIDTNVGCIYFVEHEDIGHELKEDCLVLADQEKAVKAFKKAVKRLTQLCAESLNKVTF